MKKTISLAFIFIFVISFLVSCFRDTRPEHLKEADGFTNQFINHALKKHNLVCFGSGGGFMEQINRFHLSFYSGGEKSIDEFRKLMVFVIDDFITQINSNEKIKPYLAEYPFPPERLTLSIALLGDDRKPIINKGSDTTLLTHAFLLKGKLHFHTRNEEKYPDKRKYIETYEEAYNIVNEQFPGMLTSEQAW
jgi:hypothetical protein